MLKIFLAFVRKETFHILRDTRTLVILFGMPIALVLIFGYTISNEFKGASIAIVDEARDALSAELIAHLTASGHFELVAQPPDMAGMEKAFQTGEVKLGIVIPAGFEQSFFREKRAAVQLLADATEPNYATTLTNYATQMITAFQQEQGRVEVLPYQVGVHIQMLYNPTLVGAYNFIPGVVALILMLICAMMTSLTIAREKETGTMDLLLVSPLSPMVILLGKVTPYVVLSFVNAVIVFLLGYLVFDVPVRGSIVLLLVLCLLYLMVALGLGVLISTLAATQQTAMMTSLFTLLMPTMILSGFIFPIASMPTALQYAAHIIPAKYFIEIEKNIMLKGAGWEAVQFSSLVLVAMMLFLFAAAWRNFKVVYD
ncbi:MAG: multidrug ABC transporter permease [Bacteroidetes bacterium]|nr:MAG: multidrug ABC transporter permease [Bacteroidota bacterium]PTM10054.1 MAG: multidrug ABC transporter permease [Bacteroidota bacterium]